MFIGNAQVDRADAEPPASRFCCAVEHDSGPPGFFVDDAHVAKTQFRTNTRAQSLGNRFFSGKTLGQEGRLVASLTVLIHLRGAQDTGGKPIPVTLQNLSDTDNGRQVRTHPENTTLHQRRAAQPLINA